MAVDRETLIRRLETICTAACAGDTEAVAKVKQIRSAAEAGDGRAKLALAGLRHLYWTKQKDTHAWNTAESIYRQTAKGNPKAKVVVSAIIDRAKQGDATAVATWGRLKAIHGSTKPNALFPSGPGQARIGGYGMPQHNRAGVVVGGPTLAGGSTVVGGPTLIGATKRPIGQHPGATRISGYGYHGAGLGAHERNYANRLVGTSQLVGGQSGPNLIGGQSGPNLIGGQSGPNLVGHEVHMSGYGYHGAGLGAHERNYANRLVGGPELVGGIPGGHETLVGGYGYHGAGLGAHERNLANRLVGRNTLQGHTDKISGYGYHGAGLGAPSRNYANRLVGAPRRVVGYSVPGGHETLVGGLPIRNSAGLVIGRQPMIVGDLTVTQIQDLHDLMEAAARARVKLQVAAMVARSFTTTTKAGPSAIQQATVATIKSMSESKGVGMTSKYGTSILAAPANLTPQDIGVDLRGTI